jgi:hypothetical protein
MCNDSLTITKYGAVAGRAIVTRGYALATIVLEAWPNIKRINQWSRQRAGFSRSGSESQCVNADGNELMSG